MKTGIYAYLAHYSNNVSQLPLVHPQQGERNYSCKRKIILKTQVLTATLASATDSSEFVVPSCDLWRRIFFWFWVLLLNTIVFVACSTVSSIIDLTGFELANPLQASMPSAHVWSNFGSPASPQFLNQAPPRAQQLCLPDFLVIPHLVQVSMLVVRDGFIPTGSVRACVFQGYI